MSARLNVRLCATDLLSDNYDSYIFVNSKSRNKLIHIYFDKQFEIISTTFQVRKVVGEKSSANFKYYETNPKYRSSFNIYTPQLKAVKAEIHITLITLYAAECLQTYV